MVRYEDIADALRTRILAGEFPIGGKLPSIAVLQAEYGGASLGTVRSAQQKLVDEGLLRTEQGVGAFVVSTSVVERAVQVIELLEQARAALTTAIDALRRNPT